jgi:hypothetical protein
VTHETGDVRQVIERLRRFAERVYADKADLWPTPERPYVVKHDRANCDNPEHLGCAHVGLVEAARAAADTLESLTKLLHSCAVARRGDCPDVMMDIEALPAEIERDARYTRELEESLLEAKRVSQPAPSGWQPIESAPKDGTHVLVYRELPPWRVMGTGYWCEVAGVSGWICRGISDPPGNLGLSAPTHWMPLPPAPGQNAVDALPPAPQSEAEA